MRIGSGMLGWALIAVGGFALGVVGFNLFGGDDDEAAPGAEPSATEVQVRPSDFARQALPARLLDLYLEIGEDLGLDWSVIAAVDQVDGRAGPAEETERIAAIGHSLQALGATTTAWRSRRMVGRPATRARHCDSPTATGRSAKRRCRAPPASCACPPGAR